MPSYNFDVLLLAIKKYSMNEKEEAAYRMLIDYLQLKNLYFPHYMLEKISRKDPRKSHYFRTCYKAVSNDALKPEHRRLYVKAQLQILKKLNVAAVVSVECLVGPKAWTRWEFWFKKYSQQRSISAVEENPITSDLIERIRHEIKLSIAFLKRRREKRWNIWIKTGAVSLYFLACHPDGKKIADSLGISLDKCFVLEEMKELCAEIILDK